MAGYIFLIVCAAAILPQFIEGQVGDEACASSANANAICGSCSESGKCVSGKYTKVAACDTANGEFCIRNFGGCFLLSPTDPSVKECICDSASNECRLDPFNSYSYIKCSSAATDIYKTCTTGTAPSNCLCVATSTSTSTTSSSTSTTSTSTPSTSTTTSTPTTTSTSTTTSTPTTTSTSTTTSTPPTTSTSTTTSTPETTSTSTSSTPLTTSSTSTPTPSISTSTSTTSTTSTSSTGSSTTSSTSTPTSTPTTSSTSTSTPTTTSFCPACGYLAGPDCLNYFYCVGGTNLPVKCPTNACFNQASCECDIQSTSTSPIPTTTPTCPACGFLPGADCTNYYYCGGGAMVPVKCPANSCYDQPNCQCEIVTTTTTTPSTTTPTTTTSTTSSTTTPTTTSTTSSTTTSTTSSTTTPTTTSTTSSTTTPTTTSTTSSTTTPTTTSTTTSPTTTKATCPACGYVAASQTDCQSYIYCADGGTAGGRCPGTTCFVQSSCSCANTVTTASPTTSGACPACGYVDASPTECHNYYYCGGGGSVLGTCPGTTCFVQSSCSCASPG